MTLGRARGLGSAGMLDWINARRSSGLKAVAEASARSSSETKSGGICSPRLDRKGKTSESLPAETNSRIWGSLKMLRRITASTTASSVAGAFGSNCMNSRVNSLMKCPPPHTIRPWVFALLASGIQKRRQRLRNGFIRVEEASVIPGSDRFRQRSGGREPQETALDI